jgi:hypothetical protein
MIFEAYRKGYLKINGYLLTIWFITLVSFCAAILFCHGNLLVSLFGVRTLALHFSVIFVIGQVTSREDVLKIGITTLWLTIPMTLLMGLQFYSPQSSWVNIGVGGDIEGAGFSGAMGYFRPPGTFSFITGLVFFYSISTSFVLYFLIDGEQINKILLTLSTVCIIVAIPMSISRTLLFQVLLSVFFFVIIALQRRKLFLKIIFFLGALIILLLIMNKLSFFQNINEVFISRFESASDSEGGIKGTVIDRFLGSFLLGFNNDEILPFWGFGLGIGTNAGAALLTGDRRFLVAEEEWARIIGEMGLIMGLLFLIVRTTFIVNLLIRSFKAIKNENILPWMLLSSGFMLILRGQWAQPNTLGFATLLGGLIIGSLRSNNNL